MMIFPYGNATSIKALTAYGNTINSNKKWNISSIPSVNLQKPDYKQLNQLTYLQEICRSSNSDAYEGWLARVPENSILLAREKIIIFENELSLQETVLGLNPTFRFRVLGWVDPKIMGSEDYLNKNYIPNFRTCAYGFWFFCIRFWFPNHSFGFRFGNPKRTGN